jgi:hypothetical protein
MQYTSGVIVVPCRMNSTITTPFLSLKTVAIIMLAGRGLVKLSLFVW